MQAFRAAVEAWDFEAVEQLLAEDCRFTSPVAFRPYEGRAITAAILRGVGRVFTDFTYVREINDTGGHSALVFTARVGEVEVNGCDFIEVDDDGKIVDLMVMVRPLSAARALADAMGQEFERIAAEAAASTT